MRGHFRIALLACVALATPVLAVEADLRSVSGMVGHDRVLLVFAPTVRDPRLEQERKIMAHFILGAAERDLILVQVAEGKVLGAHDDEEKLRDKFHTPPQRFRVLLIGRDGKIALDSPTPLDEHRIAAAIDAMPMRQAEIAHAKAGHPLPKSN
jgi:hypothetical protein